MVQFLPYRILVSFTFFVLFTYYLFITIADVIQSIPISSPSLSSSSPSFSTSSSPSSVPPPSLKLTEMFSPSTLIRIIQNSQNASSSSSSIYLFVILYLYKQMFCIPGSFFINLSMGASLGILKGMIIAQCGTAIGATACYLMTKFTFMGITMEETKKHSSSPSSSSSLSSSSSSSPFTSSSFLSPFSSFLHSRISRYSSFFHRISSRVAKERKRNNLLFYCLFLRLFPLSPNWLINLISPFIPIPLSVFVTSLTVGLIPYNYITVSTGAVLRSLLVTAAESSSSSSSSLSSDVIGNLSKEVYKVENIAYGVLLAVLALLPIIIKKMLLKEELEDDDENDNDNETDEGNANEELDGDINDDNPMKPSRSKKSESSKVNGVTITRSGRKSVRTSSSSSSS